MLGTWFAENGEWFVAALALFASIVISIITQVFSNRISRSDFIYRINEDFSENDTISKMYEWLHKCHEKNINISNCRELDPCGSGFPEGFPSFVEIDTYINHFEAVYVIRKDVKMKNINNLFQQRFLTFMHNPFVQRKVLCPNFESNSNIFALYSEWINMACNRFKNDWKGLAEYLNQYTCGNYEYDWISTEPKDKGQKQRIVDYIWDICNPRCKMGWNVLAPEKKDKPPLTVRITKSTKEDVSAICKLELDIVEEVGNTGYYFPAGKDIKTEIESKRCIALQINDGDRIAAFAYIIIGPEKEKYWFDLDEEKIKNVLRSKIGNDDRNNAAVLDTVFVGKDYRGYGMQSLLIDVLCHLAHHRGATSVWAVVHPENIISVNNFKKNGFTVQKENLEINRDGELYTRNLYGRDIRNLEMRSGESKEYYIDPDEDNRVSLKIKTNEEKD